MNDLIFASKDENLILQTREELEKHFQFTNLGKIIQYLRIQIDQHKDDFFTLNQSQYIEKILVNWFSGSKTIEDPVGYRIHENQNITVNTRSDIAASVAILSQHNVGATATDWNEAKRVTRYLKGTKDLKLGDIDNEDRDSLIGHVDVDWP